MASCRLRSERPPGRAPLARQRPEAVRVGIDERGRRRVDAARNPPRAAVGARPLAPEHARRQRVDPETRRRPRRLGRRRRASRAPRAAAPRRTQPGHTAPPRGGTVASGGAVAGRWWWGGAVVGRGGGGAGRGGAGRGGAGRRGSGVVAGAGWWRTPLAFVVPASSVPIPPVIRGRRATPSRRHGRGPGPPFALRRRLCAQIAGAGAALSSWLGTSVESPLGPGVHDLAGGSHRRARRCMRSQSRLVRWLRRRSALYQRLVALYQCLVAQPAGRRRRADRAARRGGDPRTDGRLAA